MCCINCVNFQHVFTWVLLSKLNSVSTYIRFPSVALPRVRMCMLQATVRHCTVSFLTLTFGWHYFLVPLSRFGPWASMRGHKGMDGWLDIDGHLVNIRMGCNWLRNFTTSFGIRLFILVRHAHIWSTGTYPIVMQEYVEEAIRKYKYKFTNP